MRRRRPEPVAAPDPAESAPAEPPPAVASTDDARVRRGDCGLFERIPAHERFAQDRSPLKEWAKRWILGRDRVPIPSYIGLIEDAPKQGEQRKTGICCSGGGIRSAAFNLGALQELQSAGRLQDAKYIAAVSGGSYIAAAFSMVAKTPKTGDNDKAIRFLLGLAKVRLGVWVPNPRRTDRWLEYKYGRRSRWNRRRASAGGRVTERLGPATADSGTGQFRRWLWAPR